MRHRVVKKTLGRNTGQRKALMISLSEHLIEQGKINTTLAKAKYLRPVIEKIITKAVKAVKTDNKITKFNAVKLLRKYLKSESAIKKLLDDVAPRFKDRPGGYTKIVKTGNRDGDKAATARIELVSTIEETKEKLKKKAIKKDEDKTK